MTRSYVCVVNVLYVDAEPAADLEGFAAQGGGTGAARLPVCR